MKSTLRQLIVLKDLQLPHRVPIQALVIEGPAQCIDRIGIRRREFLCLLCILKSLIGLAGSSKALRQLRRRNPIIRSQSQQLFLKAAIAAGSFCAINSIPPRRTAAREFGFGPSIKALRVCRAESRFILSGHLTSPNRYRRAGSGICFLGCQERSSSACVIAVDQEYLPQVCLKQGGIRLFCNTCILLDFGDSSGVLFLREIGAQKALRPPGPRPDSFEGPQPAPRGPQLDRVASI